MSGQTYKAQGIVLRKTKLGESDLIVTLLCVDGSQIRAVAKGARKPRNANSARLELFSIVELLCSKGRSLDVISDVSLVDSNDAARSGIERSSCASVVVELADKISQAGLEVPRMYDMTKACLGAICTCRLESLCPLVAAYCLKAFALNGFAPSLGQCCECGSVVDAAVDAPLTQVRFSCEAGGVVCERCYDAPDVKFVMAREIGWMRYLISSTFSDVVSSELEAATALHILDLCQGWSRSHVGSTIKSLSFMKDSGIFLLPLA